MGAILLIVVLANNAQLMTLIASVQTSLNSSSKRRRLFIESKLNENIQSVEIKVTYSKRRKFPKYSKRRKFPKYSKRRKFPKYSKRRKFIELFIVTETLLHSYIVRIHSVSHNLGIIYAFHPCN